jgi:iron(II)-dependent oxidoreductase
LRWNLDDVSERVEPKPGTPVVESVLAVHDRSPIAERSSSRPIRFAGGQADAHLANAFRGKDAGVRVAALSAALDIALDQWWRANLLPSAALLRDGLLALEAGQALEEGHRTLLLRAALLHRKGMITALRHQTDPERTASILKEAILDVRTPLRLDVLWRLRQEDEQSQTWAPLLLRDLKDELRSAQGLPQHLAKQALVVIQGKRPPAQEKLHRVDATLQDGAPARPQPSYWSPGRMLILVLLIVAILIGAGLHWGRAPKMSMVSIPSGTYVIGDVDDVGGVRSVELAGFGIDQNEVTNQQYGECIAAGECLPLASVASARRSDYFTDPVYARYPVVNVDWEGARRYCERLAKRLPTADEWEVAASFAPALQRHYRYPWGETFDSRLANTQASGQGDTQAVGSYHPAGNSSLDLMDMAGNVAEWTGTPASGEQAGFNAGYVVKGGSFRDAPADVQTHVKVNLDPLMTADWLGFRCAGNRPR